MSVAAANTVWARALVDELARAGVTDVVLAPGSRSTPLVLAFAADGRFRLRVHLDERSAAFFALGFGKVARRPAAVVTTSGTATANVLPAVVEASLSETPLLVLTADRPTRLRDGDANQVTDQLRMYEPYARASFELAPPTLGGPELRHLRTVAGRAVAAALGMPAGPAHLNCPFDKPLEPVADAGADFAAEHTLAATGRPRGAPFVRVGAPARSRAADDELDALAELLSGAERPLLIAGPAAEPARTGPEAVRLAARRGCPLVADALSGSRYCPAGGALVVGAYDLFLRDGAVHDRLAPSLVVRVGQSPTSAALERYLLHASGVRHVVIDGGGRWKDHEALVTDYVVADPAGTLRALAERVEEGASAEWADAWRDAEGAARTAATAAVPHEGDVLAAALDATPSGGTLFVSSSMPVRDLDAFGAPREEPVLALGNRGASGIDGIVSSACGASAASGAPTVCVLGDIALFHDQNGLLWSRERDVAVVFVLIDNDGGAIFHELPVREHEPHFTPYFATPHGLDFAHSAALFGVELTDVGVEDVGGAVSDALAAGGTRVVRVRSEREANRARHAEVVAAVRGSVRDALGISND